jgi:hypothetical protein
LQLHTTVYVILAAAAATVAEAAAATAAIAATAAAAAAAAATDQAHSHGGHGRIPSRDIHLKHIGFYYDVQSMVAFVTRIIVNAVDKGVFADIHVHDIMTRTFIGQWPHACLFIINVNAWSFADMHAIHLTIYVLFKAGCS